MVYCQLCLEELSDGNWSEIDGWLYCHNQDWVIPGGTCWEQRAVQDFMEWEPLLWYGFDCSGCEVDSDGECTCTSDGWSPGGGV